MACATTRVYYKKWGECLLEERYLFDSLIYET